MKKFIAAFDGLNFSESTLDYAIYLAKMANAHLVGVFLDDVNHHSYSVKDITEFEGSFNGHINSLDAKDREERDEAADYFRESCMKADLNYSLHRDRNVALQELLHESVYGDLLIINNHESMTRFDEQAPSSFIRELLTDVQCPVILVPDVFTPMDHVSFLYDGGPSSVYAVKMFSYLFPAFENLEVLSVKSEDDTLHVPDNRLMKEFMKRHYPDAEYVVLRGKPEEKIMLRLGELEQPTMIVLGAYQRGRVSYFFKKSMADHLVQKFDFPLFIAHYKS
jgi:hypothetical protein